MLKFFESMDNYSKRETIANLVIGACVCCIVSAIAGGIGLYQYLNYVETLKMGELGYEQEVDKGNPATLSDDRVIWVKKDSK